ncbi:hypothetical protein B0J12DRAFT_202245 [Macrophomina phaseolina]|uniref:Zn(2)-C6 fungal-type domain-containing protein n=1 Tax=Macrophomina phaseolina TaxID=35725 RepID=A0ABQ8G2N3_9PEZI|nr:hypothetical protein B0J12DRAFT_202245 [Macrophomina phaseolina]
MAPAADSPSPSNNILERQWERMRKSCDACQDAKVKCSQQKPFCRRCERHCIPCVYSPQRRIGRPRKRPGPPSPGRVVFSAASANGRDKTEHRGCREGSEGQGIQVGAGADQDGDVNLLDAPGAVDTDNRFINSGSGSGSGSGSSSSSSSSTSNSSGVFRPASSPNYAVGGAASPFTVDLFGDLSLFPTRDYDIAPLPPPPTTSSSSASSSTPTASILLGPAGSIGLESVSNSASDHAISSIAPAGCTGDCYGAVLQQLQYFHSRLPETTRPGIDTILLAERDMRSNQERVMACAACAANRSVLLLLAVVAERIVQMLDQIFETKSLLDAERAASSARSARRGWRNNSASSPFNVGGRSPSAASSSSSSSSSRVDSQHQHQQQQQQQQQQQRSADYYACPLPLQVGSVKVNRDSKDLCLKQLLQLRLTRLAAVLRDLQQASTVRPGDILYFSGELLLSDSLQRLEFLRGQVQVWD